MIGMNLWFIPHNSEHWPVMKPDRLIFMRVAFSRPGIESILIPIDGMAHEWITSFLVVIKRIHLLLGRRILLFTERSRGGLFFFINLS